MAEDQKVGQGVAAEAVAAVDAARDLTCGVEARDHVAVLVEDLGLLVDAKTAHRVVDGRRDRHGVERRLHDRIADEDLRHGERLRILGHGGLVVGLHGLLEVLPVDAGLAGKVFKRVGLEGIAVGDGGLDLLLLDRALVVDREGNLTGLLQDAVGDLVAATRFVDEAQAVAVNVRRVGRTGGDGGLKLAVLRIAVRMDLDPLHAREAGACGDGFLKHFAGGSRRV